MQTAYVLTGTLWKGEIELDEELPQSGYRVRVIVEVLGPIEDEPQQSLQKVMNEIHEEQRQRGSHGTVVVDDENHGDAGPTI